MNSTGDSPFIVALVWHATQCLVCAVTSSLFISTMSSSQNSGKHVYQVNCVIKYSCACKVSLPPFTSPIPSLNIYPGICTFAYFHRAHVICMCSRCVFISDIVPTSFTAFDDDLYGGERTHFGVQSGLYIVDSVFFKSLVCILNDFGTKENTMFIIRSTICQGQTQFFFFTLWAYMFMTARTIFSDAVAEGTKVCRAP